MSSPIHHLGTGWEPQVHEVDTKLIYSIPVESGFVSRDFEFTIQALDLDILKASKYRYAVLFHALHTLLQNTFGAGVKAAMLEQKDFEKLTAEVLHSSDENLKGFIEIFSKAHHMNLQVYVDQYLNKSK